MDSPLHTDALTKTYGGAPALDRFGLTLERGEIFALLGPNGAGKTTLISILTGLLDPTSGSARIFGRDIKADSMAARRLVGVVPQEIVSHGFFSLNQILRFHSGYYGLGDNQKRIDYLLDRLSLAPHRDKPVSQLSGGMKRRMLIAKALVHSPPLLLLDEPTAGVDVELRVGLWEFVRELNAAGVTVLLTTHYLEEAEELCGRVGVIHQGRLIALDQTRALIGALTHREVTLRLSQPWDPGRSVPGVAIEGATVRAEIRSEQTVGSLIKELGLPLEWVADISVAEGRLEDAFVNLIKKHEQTRAA